MSIDHAAQARKWLAKADAANTDWTDMCSGMAQAHALLAVAAEQRIANMVNARASGIPLTPEQIGTLTAYYMTATQPEGE